MTEAQPDEPMRPASADSRRSEEQLRVLVESVEEYAVFMLDPDGHVVTWNAGAQRIKGYAAGEVIGRHIEIFYPDEVVARGWPREELRLAAERGRFEDEGWRVRKDGTRFWASVLLTALRDEHGGLRGFAKVTRDLTGRRRREEALRAHEEQLHLLVDSVKDYAIFLLDPRGHVLTWNAGAAAINGYTAEEVVNRHFAMFFTAEDVAAGVPARELATALLEGRAEAEGWRVRKDGSMFWANAVITPVFDANQVLRGFAKVTRDLTESRRLLELEHSSRRLREFLAVLGHELRNPLAPIRNAVSIMQMQPDFPRALVGALDTVDRQLDYLTRLVDDLLDLGRIVTGKILLQHRPIDYRDLVLSSVDAVRPLIQARGQQLVLDVPQESIPTVGDDTRLAQSLQNLLQNAIRYTPRGGEIRVTVRTDALHADTVVADTGRGIAPEAIQRIFELFEQEGVRDSSGGGGLGIGLSLARTLIEQHGGTLSAHSEGRGRGSTFTIRLPLHRRQSVAEPAAASEAAPVRSKAMRVLVVDDNRDSADTMVYIVQLLGHDVRGAYGAEQAVSVADEFQPRVVLLDLNMPDGDGFSVMKRLRERLPGPLYVAAMTGYGQADDRRSTLEAGFQAHLTKPVQVEQLKAALRDASPAPGCAD